MDIQSYDFKNLYGKEEYDKIIEISNDPQVKNTFNEWHYFYYAQSLNKKGMYQDSLSCFKECKKKYPGFLFIDGVMCRALYHDKIKTFDVETGDKEKLFSIVDYAIKHCKQEKFSAYEHIINIALKTIFFNKASNAVNYNDADKYLSLLNPSLLSDEERIKTLNGREMKVASAKEKWYTRKTKTLEKLENYEECIEIINLAFDNINRFHNNANHWLMYRKALCYYHLGELGLAENILNEELKAFNHWSLNNVLFKINRDIGNQELAFQYAATAALCDGDHKLRVTLYSELAEYLQLLGREDEAELHIRLVEMIREEEEWREDKKFKDYEVSDDISHLGKKEVIDKLIPIWEEYKYMNKEFVKGEVRRFYPMENPDL